jgi:hypothetical protein
VHIYLKQAFLEEVWVGLSSNANWIDGEGGISFTTSDEEGAPLAEVLAFLQLISWHNILSKRIDVGLERSNETFDIVLLVLRLFDAVGLEQGLSLYLNLSERAVFTLDLAEGMVVSGIPEGELSEKVLGTCMMQPLLIDFCEIDVHGSELGVGGPQQVKLFILEKLDLAHDFFNPPGCNSHHFAKDLLLLLG